MRLLRFVLLTLGGFLVFALTMTFVPVLPAAVHQAARAALLVTFGVLWWLARDNRFLNPYRAVLFAYFTAVLALSLGYFFGDSGLQLFALTTRTPAGIAVAKLSQALLVIVGVLVTARLCGVDLASLYIRKGRLLSGLGVGTLGAAACAALALQQPGVRSIGAAGLVSLAPWVVLFAASNALMEELVFRGLFLSRYEPLIGRWPAIVSTALAFTLAHMQVTYTPDVVAFLVVLLALSIAWAWLMQKSGSLWGSALFHAGADLLIVLPIFRGLGAA